MNKLLAKKAGLVPFGVDHEGDMEFMGTEEKWENYKKLAGELEAHDCHASPEDGCQGCELIGKTV